LAVTFHRQLKAQLTVIGVEDFVVSERISTEGRARISSGQLVLLGAAIAFILMRLPMMYRVPADEDENCYGAPGLTVLESGVPRLPHVPARNLDSVYYKADQALFAEPPLSFYWQAAFYAVFPKTLGTARLSSAVAGALLLWCVFRLAVRSGVSEMSAALACAALSLSRWFFFPAVRARPEIVCVLFGMLAVSMTWVWCESRRRRDLVLTGFLIGSGGLAHPAALVYAVQIAFWIALISRGSQRIIAPLVVGATAILTAGLWFPLIVVYPDAFKVQFHNQFLGSSNSSPFKNLIWPWESFAYHGESLLWYLGNLQCGLVAVAILAALVATGRRPSPFRTVAWLSLSGFLLTAIIVGPHHRVYGYFLYPAALSFVLIGRGIDAVVSWGVGRGISSVASQWGVAAVLTVLLLPGSGLRMLAISYKHWNDVNYNTPAFCAALMESLPPDAAVIVDEPFVIEFIAQGRNVLLAQTAPFYFRAQDFPCDFLVLGRPSANREKLLQHFPVELVKTFGDRDDPFACFAEIYRRR
jgi:hypothetical protein